MSFLFQRYIYGKKKLTESSGGSEVHAHSSLRLVQNAVIAAGKGRAREHGTNICLLRQELQYGVRHLDIMAKDDSRFPCFRFQ